MRRGKANKLSGRYDFGFLPESREMPLVAGHQIVSTGSIGTLQEYIVIGVTCHFKASRRGHDITVVLDKLHQLLAKAFANLQFWTGKNVGVFLHDGARYIQTRWLGYRE